MIYIIFWYNLYNLVLYIYTIYTILEIVCGEFGLGICSFFSMWGAVITSMPNCNDAKLQNTLICLLVVYTLFEVRDGDWKKRYYFERNFWGEISRTWMMLNGGSWNEVNFLAWGVGRTSASRIEIVKSERQADYLGENKEFGVGILRVKSVFDTLFSADN